MQIGRSRLRTAAPFTSPIHFLFPNLKKSLIGQILKQKKNEKVIAATEIYFTRQRKTYASCGLR